jgi:AraC-like DNA-binding protein
MSAAGQRYPLEKPLSDLLGHLYGIQGPAAGATNIYHLAPDLEMMLVLNFGTPLSYFFGNESKRRKIERICILGPLRQMMTYEVQAGADLLILPFIHDGFYRFLKLPVDKLMTDTLDDLKVDEQNRLLEEIWTGLAAIADMEQRVRMLKSWLLEHINPSDQEATPLLTGISALHDPVLNPVVVMAEDAVLSERTIQLRFKKYTGYSPKELLRFLRFKQVISYLDMSSNSKIDWFELILKFGYHDQSHLIKDFKYFTGTSPKNFVKLQRSGSFCVSRA